MEAFSTAKLKEIAQREEIIKIVHRHWFNIAVQFAIIIAMVIVLVAGLAFFPILFSFFQETSFRNLLFFVASLMAIFIWVYAFFIWIDYYFDIWIITSERIINIEQKGLFIRSMSEVKFNRIQDVTAEEKGVIPTLLDYGDVYIQTAGEKERFVFRKVPHPYALKDIIINMQKKRIKSETDELGEMIREEIHKEQK